MNGRADAMELDLAADKEQLIVNGLVVEASAGTGKTYSVAGIVTRALAEDESLRISNVLITTYTRNAAAELKDRIRRRLADTAAALARGEIDAGDKVLATLAACDSAERADRVVRLERAAVEFDSATIGTIHSICHRVLKAAGQRTSEAGDEDLTRRVVAEVANDFVVTEAAAGRRWEEHSIADVIRALLGDPHIETWFDAERYSQGDGQRLESLKLGLAECVKRVHARMESTPSYNDLLRRARDIVKDPAQAPLVESLKRRYRLAIVDEAQDTDSLQWEFFQELFPAGDHGDGRVLIAVGDPKQSIYGFRGADVTAFVRYVASCGGRRRTLTTNRRSDAPVLDGLNRAFTDAEFGSGIRYIDVHAPEHQDRPGLAAGIPAEFIDIGQATNQDAAADAAAKKVFDILDTVRLGPDGRSVKPGEVCVLVRSGAVAERVQRQLAHAGVRAVTAGTSSVAASDMAVELRTLLEAIDQPSSMGRIRRVAGGMFFGHSLRYVGGLGDDVLLAVQERIAGLSQTLRRAGVAAMGAVFLQDADVMARVAAGARGERNLTDLTHLVEAMHVHGVGRGCTAGELLELLSELGRVDGQSDLVSRRVESDADAVKIMTIHKAKGLEFPCVVVADLWKHAEAGKAKTPHVFYDHSERRLDIGFTLGSGGSSRVVDRVKQAADEEARRLLYVAATRPEHHVSILVATAAERSILQELLTLPEAMRPLADLPAAPRPTPAAAPPPALVVAPAASVIRTHRRQSYTGLVGSKSGRPHDPFAPEGGGSDEETAVPREETRDFRIPDLPGGTDTGTVIHEILEHVDPCATPLDEEVHRVVVERAAAGPLARHHDALVRMITESLQTPWGGPFGDVTFAHISKADRIAEVRFEMSLVSLATGVKARRIGEVLERALAGRRDDPLAAYAGVLQSPSFNAPVGGLLTGSIDAVVRLPDSLPEAPRLAICDYKSNKLHANDAAAPLDAYDQSGLLEEMFDHHYPLQALLYGTALYRMLRWRLPRANPDECITGVVYAFIRGMKGPTTPVDPLGRRHGVFTWQAPAGLWAALSDLLAGREAA